MSLRDEKSCTEISSQKTCSLTRTLRYESVTLDLLSIAMVRKTLLLLSRCFTEHQSCTWTTRAMILELISGPLVVYWLRWFCIDRFSRPRMKVISFCWFTTHLEAWIDRTWISIWTMSQKWRTFCCSWKKKVDIDT